jgi:hypothetical protein
MALRTVGSVAGTTRLKGTVAEVWERRWMHGNGDGGEGTAVIRKSGIAKFD